MYLPTWRDYNYSNDDSKLDFSYFLDKDKLMEYLGDDYTTYLDESNTEELNESLRGTYNGIGITILNNKILISYLNKI